MVMPCPSPPAAPAPARDQPQTMSPEPVLLVEQLAPPPILTSPDPSTRTPAVLIACAPTLPEPVTEASSLSATSPPASMPPDPVTQNQPDPIFTLRRAS